jgi:3-oxoacyl-[acyl-carrier-protein] synthase-3
VTPADRIGIIGRGYALGELVRGNDDPVFQFLRAHPPPDRDLFEGLRSRRVLGGSQTVVSISVEAGRQALASASLSPHDVDMLLGVVSVGKYCAPSALAETHALLGLPERCRILALNTEYTGFLDGLKIACDMMRAGSISRALIVAGIDWTAHMDYREAVSVAASDAAGAAVLAPTTDATAFTIIDWDNETDSRLYGALRMAPRQVTPPRGYRDTEKLYTAPLYEIDPQTGGEAIRTFGMAVPPMVVNRLLARHGLRGGDVTLIAHQVSRPFFDEWRARIRPARFISTLEECADMVSATVPVNLAMCYERIETDLLVLLGVGMEMHATALLCARNGRLPVG